MVTSPPFQGMQSIEFKLAGLRHALSRLWPTRGAADMNEAAFAIFEVMNWVHSLQDGGQLDVIAKTDVERELLLGVCGARAAMHHLGFDPIEWRAEGLKFPLKPNAFPLVDRGRGFEEWWWRAGLPAVNSRDQREAYQRRLEGRLVRHILDEVTAICDRYSASLSNAQR